MARLKNIRGCKSIIIIIIIIIHIYDDGRVSIYSCVGVGS